MKNIKWQYALGEILIVIIGVTIAFSMNKCAENKKDSALRAQYLENLKSDIESDKLQLQENVKKFKKKFNTIDSLVLFLKRESGMNSDAGMKLFEVSTLIEFNAKDITYSSLIHSGDMKLISDLSLKTQIEEHYSKSYGKLHQDYERLENIHKKYLADYYINHINYDELYRGKFNLENKKYLKNILYSMRGAIQIKITSTQQSITSCDTTLARIEKGLKAS